MEAPGGFMSRRRTFAWMVPIVVGLLGAGTVYGQAYPNKPIRYRPHFGHPLPGVPGDLRLHWRYLEAGN